jgi:hypothetical protein
MKRLKSLTMTLPTIHLVLLTLRGVVAEVAVDDSDTLTTSTMEDMVGPTIMTMTMDTTRTFRLLNTTVPELIPEV